MSKKKEVRQEIHHPPTDEFPEGRIEEVFWDGTNRFIDKNGNSILPATPNTRIEAWKKAPKEQALKEADELSSNTDLDPAEKRVNLEIIKFKAELQGATAPDKNGLKMPLIMIQVNAPGEPFRKPMIDVSAKESPTPP